MAQSDGRWLGHSLIALTRAEARRITLHPAVLLAFALLVGPWIYRILGDPTLTWFTDLTSESWEVQLPMLLMAAAVLLAACSLAVRSARFRNLEWESGQAVTLPQQVAAQVVAVLPTSLLAFGSAALWLQYLGSRPGATGEIGWSELLTVPAMVLLAGTLGVMLGRVTGSFPASLLVVALLAVPTLIGLITAVNLRWLGFIATENSFNLPPAPASLVSRPAAAHAAWLVGLAGLSAIGVLMHAGLRRRLGYSLMVGLLVICVAASAMQLGATPMQRTAAWRHAVSHPAGAQECTSSGNVTFCYFPDFEDQVPAWSDVVSSQLRVIPRKIAEQSFYVRQRLTPASEGPAPPTLPLAKWEASDARANTPNSVPVSTRWAAAGVDTFDQTQVLAFGVSFAMRVVVGESPTDPSFGRQGQPLCGSPGMLVYWLGTAPSKATASALDVVKRHTAGSGGLAVDVLGSGRSIIIGAREAELGDELARLPLAQITSVINNQWARLASPATSLEEAARILGIEPPAQIPQRDRGLCP